MSSENPVSGGETEREPRTGPPEAGGVGPTSAYMPRAAADGRAPDGSTIRTAPPSDTGATRISSELAGPAATDEDFDGPVALCGRPQPGQVLFGLYRLETLLGEGGMGSVWLVHNLELDFPRALKLIISSKAFDPDAQARFRREARIMAKLSHPNAVVVHTARIAREAAFIEMEHVRGESLNKLLKAGVPMPLDWTARILVQLCDVLQEAHGHMIVHRDLKPSNLMLKEGLPAGKEFLKVLDFGIAKVLEPGEEPDDLHTQTGSFMGTAQYSSPEQAGGGPVDGRSDLYSVGVMLYEFLTGRRPFEGPMTRQLYDHLHTPPPPFSFRNASAAVPREVERVVLRCLAKDPAKRPQTAHELAEEFVRAMNEDSGTLWPHPPEPPGRPEEFSAPRTTSPYSPYVPVEPTPSQAAATEDEFGERRPTASLTEPLPLGGPLPPLVVAPPAPDLATVGPVKKAGLARPPWWSRRKWLLVSAGGALGLSSLLPRAFRNGHNASPGLPPGFTADPKSGLEQDEPRVLVRDLGAVSVRFIRIEGGRFVMGDSTAPVTTGPETEDVPDDLPAHPVQLSTFYLQENEVTNGEMEAYFESKPVPEQERPPLWRAACQTIHKKGYKVAIYPAVGISHATAADFAAWIGGRLPTEAQWEYAARSRGLTNLYVSGTGPLGPNEANVDSKEIIGGVPTKPVGTYEQDRTRQGINDLTGNVREWCRDHWARYSSAAQPRVDPLLLSPSAPDRTGFVIRGGSFASYRDKVRTTWPRRHDPENMAPEIAAVFAKDGVAIDLGFRVVIEWPPRS